MSLVFANFNRPGVRVVETTAGYRVLQLASFQAIYMIGSGTTGSYMESTLVKSLTDFTNQFGGSPSESSVQLFFRNDRQGILYFVRTPILTRFRVVVDSAAAGAYTLTINGTEVTHNAIEGNTVVDIAAALINAVNISSVAANVTAVAGTDTDEVVIRSDRHTIALTVVATTPNMTATDVTPIAPEAIDYIYAIDNTFDYEEDWAQGFMLAPEAFQRLTSQSDRITVGLAMEQFCANENFDWFAILDCGASVDTVAELTTEGQSYSSPQGHSAYYGPYLKDLEGDVVPPSAAVAGIATRRFREEGFHQPMAGAKYPILGVSDVLYRFTNQDQEVLNPLGINLVRYLRNKGVVVWAMRTRSADAFYRFTVTRIIMNVLNGTLRRGFDFDLFNSIDGQGILLSRIEETARAVCRRLWRSKALFGDSEESAFEVICNFENNTADELENGNVLIEVYVAPSPAVERILVNTVRVPIGQVQAAAQAGQQ